jgi:hypothetical protein
MISLRTFATTLSIIVAALALTSCSAVELDAALGTAKAAAAERAAVGSAEAIRLVIIEEAAKRTLSADSLLLLAEVAKGVPGATLLVNDANGDDRDDDGKVTVGSLGGSACLVLPTATTAGATTAGACA